MFHFCFKCCFVFHGGCCKSARAERKVKKILCHKEITCTFFFTKKMHPTCKNLTNLFFRIFVWIRGKQKQTNSLWSEYKQSVVLKKKKLYNHDHQFLLSRDYCVSFSLSFWYKAFPTIKRIPNSPVAGCLFVCFLLTTDNVLRSFLTEYYWQLRWEQDPPAFRWNYKTVHRFSMAGRRPLDRNWLEMSRKLQQVRRWSQRRLPGDGQAGFRRIRSISKGRRWRSASGLWYLHRKWRHPRHPPHRIPATVQKANPLNHETWQNED